MKESSPPVTESAADPLIGRVLDGRFRIQGLIARGGMGAIYRAEQQPLKRTVALKVLAPEGSPHEIESFRSRFFREASICSRLTHPNTVRIYDYGKTDDGVYFIAMELLSGQTLKQAMDTDAPMAPWRVINLIKQVCASLAEAHGQGLIHRDLKPSNILLTEHADGTEFVNVVDFGLVKDLASNMGDGDQTQIGTIVGSPMYMSPEQILQSDLTERSDIYSLGVILYGLLTGRKPFKQESALALMKCHLQVQPPPFAQVNPDHEVPASLEWVTLTCLAKDPAHRFASVRELSRALTACDMELRGMVSNLQLRLEAGRVILPPEVEEHLGRRGGAPVHTGDSGSFASKVSGSASIASGTLNTQPEPARPAWLIPALLLLLIGVGMAGSLLAYALLSDGAPAREAATPAEAAPEPGAPAATPAEEAEAPAAEVPTEVPTEVPPPVDRPKTTGTKPTSAKPDAKPPAEPRPPAETKPAAEARPPAETKPAAPETPPPPAEPPKGEDWAKPKSDIKNPWGK